MNINSELDLMIFIMKLLSEKFRSQAILRGGMALYLLNSTRYTNDLDYAFVPYKSKKEILKPLLQLLDSIEGLNYKYNLNSQCLRIILNYQDYNCQLEIKTYTDLKSTSVSTDAIPDSNIPSFVVRIANLEWSLSNKLAAWLERRLARDLYDVYFIYALLNVRPDYETLKKRLTKIRYAKNVKNTKTSMTIDEFVKFLRIEVSNIDSDKLKSGLRDYFSDDELAGIDFKISLALNKICEYLEEEYRVPACT